MTPTVVVADDDVDIRRLVTISAARAGLEVVDDVGDGVEAMESIRQFIPDLAILDVSMPGLTGLEICALVRADPLLSGVRILLLSASAGDNSIAAGLAAGAAGYLAKPFSPRELAQQLAAFSAGEPTGQTP